MKSRLQIRNSVINFSIVVLSISLSLLIAEGICRILFDPVDYLTPELINDEILGYRVKPNSGGHDSWGYRNKSVPATADIVAIGDSQTYGMSATANSSWPATLQKMVGKDVYNLSLGGYGPAQYYYLLENKAFKLNPSSVIVGFYYGNDLLETYGTVYGNSYWKHFRKPNFRMEQNVYQTQTSIVSENTIGFGVNIRAWLGNRSVLYKIAVHSALGDIVRLLEMKVYTRTRQNFAVLVEDSKHNISTAFTPQRRFIALDLNNPRVQEGLRISLELFSKMYELCMKENIHFLVVLIPTKESVFSDYIQNNSVLDNSEIIDELIENERRINERVKAYFREHHIPYVDVLNLLKKAVGKEQIYPSDDDHPNKNGYKIIASSVQQHLRHIK